VGFFSWIQKIKIQSQNFKLQEVGDLNRSRVGVLPAREIRVARRNSSTLTACARLVFE
jgi:hypothetical protein